MNLRRNIITSSKNKEKIAYKGFFYNKVPGKNKLLYWRCNKRGCQAYLFTDLQYNYDHIANHNHDPDTKSMIKRCLIPNLKLIHWKLMRLREK